MNNDGWISVEDRLPEEGYAVLLHAPSGAVSIGPNRGAFVTPTTITVRSGPERLQIYEATHWIPIPEFPEPPTPPKKRG